jgi:bifunctional NMN adenylyltransferase/nudix hydrolase
MDNKRNKYDIGVIIGRFQIHELHEAHKGLIDEVLSRHKKVLIFLGVSPALGTKKNPLDFVTRRKMLEENYGNQITAILPIQDKKSDEIWSKEVDTKIREAFPVGSVVLYGSRDSFIPYYKGKFETCELEPKSYVSATEVREEISQEILMSKEFRAGVIYGIYNTHPIVFSTVDIAIFNDEGQLLLGRKPLEDRFRFIGGFVDTTDESFEHAARREGAEETGVEIGDLEYISSMQVKDWRYAKEPDRSVMTHFYTAKIVYGAPKAADDIAEVRWFNIKDLNENNMVYEHHGLLQSLKEYQS